MVFGTVFATIQKLAPASIMERAHMPLPLFRQIQIGAGGLVLLGSLGGLFWLSLYWLSAFVGAGLVFAGTTGFCGLGVLLSRMPWNRTRL